MANKIKRKRRLKKAMTNRKKDRLKRAWRNIWVKSGVLKEVNNL
jgi:hypothetical protein